MEHPAIERLAACLSLHELLERLARLHGGYTLIAHWTQGEFHHDLVVEVRELRGLPGPVIVISTNCNGGVKEVAAFRAIPDREALWHARCPEGEFRALAPPELLGSARTLHWFDPCELLAESARSELREEHRRRQHGGGWVPR